MSLGLLLLLFLLSALLVFGVRYYALRFLLDHPNHRSSHHCPTPRGGGLACVVTFFLAAVFLYITQRLQLWVLGFVLIGLGVAAIGFWDDHRHIPAKWRLLAHFVAAVLTLYCFRQLPGTENLLALLLPQGCVWLGYFLATLFLVWVLNLYNFMDGIDGIAASEAIFVSLSLAWFMQNLDEDLALLALCLAVVCMGFLVWNWPPAKIFMGDVGSSFIGFMLGTLILLYSNKQAIFLGVGLILLAAFVTDASVTLLRRVNTGQKFYEAHCTHAYQILAKRWQPKGHLKVVSGVTLINIGYLFPLAAIAFYQPSYAVICLLFAYAPLIFLVYLLKAGIE